MKTVAIIGLGLIGGSLGRALRRTRRYRVIGVARRGATLREALRFGAIDEGSLRPQDAARAPIIVIATPVAQVVPTVRELLPHLRPGTVVTDVSSVKGVILRPLRKLSWPFGVHFVGGHPLAGSHQTGVKASRSDLFQNSACVLVPLNNAPLGALAALWTAAGARVQVLSAAAHDEAVAVTSHVPHVLAHAMVQALARHPMRSRLRGLVAGSFRDMTRVALADPVQWEQILRANAPGLRKALRRFRAELSSLESALARPGLRRRLARSQRFRRPLFHGQ